MPRTAAEKARHNRQKKSPSLGRKEMKKMVSQPSPLPVAAAPPQSPAVDRAPSPPLPAAVVAPPLQSPAAVAAPLTATPMVAVPPSGSSQIHSTCVRSRNFMQTLKKDGKRFTRCLRLPMSTKCPCGGYKLPPFVLRGPQNPLVSPSEVCNRNPTRPKMVIMPLKPPMAESPRGMRACTEVVKQSRDLDMVVKRIPPPVRPNPIQFLPIVETPSQYRRAQARANKPRKNVGKIKAIRKRLF